MFEKVWNLKQFFLLFLVQDSKKLTASPDGAITNENILRDYIASIEAKEDAKKELNNSSMMANQVWEAEAACYISFFYLNCYLKRYKEYINCFWKKDKNAEIPIYILPLSLFAAHVLPKHRP